MSGIPRHHTVLAGTNLKNYFGDGSDGIVNSTGDLLPTSVQDGDMVVLNFEELTLNEGHTLTPTNRCRGLLIYIKGDCTINGTISMTARGCHANPADAGVTENTPVASSDGNAVPEGGIVLRRYAKGQTDSNSDTNLFHGCGLAAVIAEANQKKLNGNGYVFAIPRVGGPGGASSIPGSNPGGTAINAPGGGGGGRGDMVNMSGKGGDGTCFCGGTGSGGNERISGIHADDYGGPGSDGFTSGESTVAAGGGAGNPGGMPHGGLNTPQPGEDGIGGLLIILVGGNLTIGATGRIESNGKDGGTASGSHGGGSGAGAVFAMYAGSLSNIGTIEAVGGLSDNGGPGGDGAVVGPLQIEKG